MPTPTIAAVQGVPRLLLRLEAAVVLALAVWTYSRFGQGWLLFAVTFLVPDLSMLGYLLGRRAGAVSYNLAHSYAGPAALGAAGIIQSQPLMTALALVWVAHVGFDRMLGYGLKYASAFGHTHLGAIGKAKAA